MVGTFAAGTAGLPVIDGVPVCTRTHLRQRWGLSLSSLEALYRERAGNGHPEPVGVIGRAKAWDAQVWDAWWSDHNDAAGLVTFEGIARRRGVSRATVATWWRDREVNGFPLWKKKIGNTLYFDPAVHDQWEDPRIAGGGEAGREGEAGR